jgi:predicted ATP-dependent protease
MTRAMPEALPAERLRRVVDVADVAAALAEPQPGTARPFGHERARDAIELALALPMAGGHLYVMGSRGVGRRAVLAAALEAAAAGRPAGGDLCYVSDFQEPRCPKALHLPAGLGRKLAADMERLVEDLADALKAAFQSEDYRTRRQVIEDELKERQEEAVEAVEKEARDQGIALLRAPTGFIFAPVKDGHVLQPDVFQALPEAEQTRITGVIEGLQKHLKEALSAIPGWMQDTRARIRQLNDETAALAVGHLVESFRETYHDQPGILEHLAALEADVRGHIGVFLGYAEAQDQAPHSASIEELPPPFRRYRVNLLVDRGDAVTAPVVFEDEPTFERLLGRIEQRVEQGVLVTDFLMVRPGALHQANGGFLYLDMQKLLSRPMAYDGLKRALKARELRIESPLAAMGLMATQSLEPEPVPLDVKVALLGDRMLFYLASELDPEFAELFKVVADFDDAIRTAGDASRQFARHVAALAGEQGLRPLEPAAMAACLEDALRRAGDVERLSADVESLLDLVREADHLAGQGGLEAIAAGHVTAAAEARERRSARLRDRSIEQVEEGIVKIATEGVASGQINGLAVLQLGGFAFGRPSRITASVRMGAGKLVDIEREAKLGGPLHSKGVLILQGYLAQTFALDFPLALSASLVFEQAYGGVDGDSASSAELYALLSAIADVPIRQDLAVTGSVDQRGLVQAIGGVNEKIEGFFDVCARRGLTGSQGVLIPSSNVRHLMLAARVVEAVAAGRFAVYPIEHIEEGLALLTGMTVGQRGADGRYPDGSLFGRVEARLRGFAEAQRRFAKPDQTEAEAWGPRRRVPPRSPRPGPSSPF